MISFLQHEIKVTYNNSYEIGRIELMMAKYQDRAAQIWFSSLIVRAQHKHIFPPTIWATVLTYKNIDWTKKRRGQLHPKP